MKKITVFISMLLIAASSFCQQTDPAPSFTKEYYQKKSKNERNTAWILAGGGLVMSSVTAAIAANDDPVGQSNFLQTILNQVFNSSEEGNDQPDDKSSLTGFLFVIGATVVITSVPLFISASKNKRKAMSLSFINQPLPQLQNDNLVYRATPSLKLKISL